MNILLMTYETAGRGGSYVRSVMLARALVVRGHSVTLIAASATSRLRVRMQEEHGVLVIESPGLGPHRLRNSGFDLWQLLWRLLYLRSHMFDVVHGFGHRPTVSLPGLFAKRHVPYIMDWADLWSIEGLGSTRTWKGKVVAYVDTILERWVVRHANAVSAISRDLVSRARRARTDGQVVHLPVGAVKSARRTKKKIRAKYAIPQGAAVFVHLGNTPNDIELLAQSFVKITTRVPKAHMVFIGPRVPVFDRIVRLAGVDSSVTYTGFVSVDQLQDVASCGDVALMPYTNTMINRARFPNKIGDYLAVGLPIVTNDTGDVGTLVRRYQVGVLAPETSHGLARAAATLMSQSKRRAQFAANARQLARRDMSWDQRAHQLERLYHDVV